jgi:hypothetical protein
MGFRPHTAILRISISATNLEAYKNRPTLSDTRALTC